MGKRFDEAKLCEGDVVQFKARVTRYVKGYRGRRNYDDDEYGAKPVKMDFRLSFPTNVRNLSQSGAVPFKGQATLL